MGRIRQQIEITPRGDAAPQYYIKVPTAAAIETADWISTGGIALLVETSGETEAKQAAQSHKHAHSYSDQANSAAHAASLPHHTHAPSLPTSSPPTHSIPTVQLYTTARGNKLEYIHTKIGFYLILTQVVLTQGLIYTALAATSPITSCAVVYTEMVGGASLYIWLHPVNM